MIPDLRSDATNPNLAYGLGLVFFVSLIALTIRLYRSNRPVVLGTLTFGMFIGFLVFARLRAEHAPAWLTLSLVAAIILLGIGLLVLVALDVITWFRSTLQTKMDSQKHVEDRSSTK